MSLIMATLQAREQDMTSTRTSIANRHIAKLLDNLECLADLPTLAKTAVKQEMHWLAEDVEANCKQEQQGTARNGNGIYSAS